MKLLLPQVEVFLRNYIPAVEIPSCEADALLSYVGTLIENGFKLDEEVCFAVVCHAQILGLFSLFTELPKERLLPVYPLVCRVFCHVK